MPRKLTITVAQPGRPRKLTRERIIAAAMQVYDEDGHHALTMRALAQRLGVNHATLYNYVGHIEDIEAEALASLMASVPVPSADNPAPMRRQLIEHLLALRELQLRHPHVLHAPIGSPTWRLQVTMMNRVLRALKPYNASLVEIVFAYNTLSALVATNAERARASGVTSHAELIEAQRRALRALPADDTEPLRRVLQNKNGEGPPVESLGEILSHFIDRLLPDIDRRKSR